jgi:hypothetical protein
VSNHACSTTSASTRAVAVTAALKRFPFRKRTRAVSVAASASTAKKVPARKEMVPFREHAPAGLEAEQALPRSEAQRVTSIPSIWAAKAAVNATLSGNVSLARIVTAIGARRACLESR